MQTAPAACRPALAGSSLVGVFAGHSASSVPAGFSLGFAVLVACYLTWPAPVGSLVAASVLASRAWPASVFSAVARAASPASVHRVSLADVLQAWFAPVSVSAGFGRVDPALQTQEQ